QHNVSEPLYLDGPVDAVLHFASPASPTDYADHPIATLKVGTLGTHNVLGLARAKGATFFLASTSEVYGDPTVHPQPESYWGNVRLLGTDYAEPINLGTDDEVSMLQLATRIRELSGSASEIIFRPLPEDDPRQRRPDLTRARKLLRWEPRTSLDAGLTKTIAYFRDRLNTTSR